MKLIFLLTTFLLLNTLVYGITDEQRGQMATALSNLCGLLKNIQSSNKTSIPMKNAAGSSYECHVSKLDKLDQETMYLDDKEFETKLQLLKKDHNYWSHIRTNLGIVGRLNRLEGGQEWSRIRRNLGIVGSDVETIN